MPDALYFEDFPPGEVVEYGGIDVSADEIIAFAREFDPQPFHIDEEAARAATGGLIASGWHTCALLLRMNCDAFLMRAAILDEAGVEEVRWQRPVRPGDRLHVRRHTLATRPREGRTGDGEVEFLYEVVNQDGVVAMTQRSLLLLKQRPQASGINWPMFYEDFRIGQSAALGQAAFSREAILAYGRRFDPRIVAQAAEGSAPLAASGLHVAAAGMRRLVDTRSASARRDGRARRDPSAAWRLARLQRHALAAPGA